MSELFGGDTFSRIIQNTSFVRQIATISISCYAIYKGFNSLYNYMQQPKYNLPKLESNWYSEVSNFWPGQCFSIKFKNILYQGKSEFQECMCLESETFGNVLVIDGAIQCTEKDECAYHEMMANIAMYSHLNPKDVLVIGGGDGGIVRELTRHPDLTTIHMCEIDEMVVQLSKIYLPNISSGFEDSRVSVKFDDGFKFVKNNPDSYDIIIVDSSDPDGPARKLFSDEFFFALSNCLRADGIAITQAESIWIHLPLIKDILTSAAKYFKCVDYSHVNVPTYPCGSIGFACCSKGQSCKSPKRFPSTKHQEYLKYYNQGVHVGSFMLPNFFKDYMKANHHNSLYSKK